MKHHVVTGLLAATALWLTFALPGGTPPARAGSACVDVALVLAVDSSASVSPEEYALQQNGIAAAFRTPEVLDAIARAGRVAVSVVFWGSEGLPKPQSAWVEVDSPAEAEAFARTVESMPREVTGDTGLGAGLMTSLAKFRALEGCAVRKIVNVSGDGEETRALRGHRRFPPPPEVKGIAAAENVEINALAISNEEADLAQYYSENVITGPNAFVMEVRDYDGFATALRKKLVREITPQMVSDSSDLRGGDSRLN